MKGTPLQKVTRLIRDLAVHREFLWRYINESLIPGRSPLDLETPWFSYSAIEFLKGHLRPEMAVCEYGSGGSTLFFARRVSSVYSIEDNAHWHALVRESLSKKAVTNATVELFPYDFKTPIDFEGSAYLHAIPDRQFDVIVVDGTEEWIQVRPTCFFHAENHVKPGGIIVVDDSWRYEALRERSRAREVRIFQSVGPCRPGVTTTDIHFY